MIRRFLAFTRIPGNAVSFWIRQTLHWSKGKPKLYQESKQDLFSYLGPEKQEAEAKADNLCKHYHLDTLAELSTQVLYRKNLYLIDVLDKATEGLNLPDSPSKKIPGSRSLKALDVGAQDWHYVFGLEKWLRFKGNPNGREVSLMGIELDGYGIYADLHSRKDYAEVYAQQTENVDVVYSIGDFLKYKAPDSAGAPAAGLGSGIDSGLDSTYDFISIFYPFVTRYQLLLWGLPLRFFSPPNFLIKSASLIRPGGWLLVFCHTQIEHDLFLDLGRKIADFELLKEGPVQSNLVDFYEEIQDRHYSIWKKI
jgi:hypothetical protein